MITSISQIFHTLKNSTQLTDFSQVEDGSQQLLTNAEQYGLYVAEALASENVNTGDEDVITLNGTFLNIGKTFL